MTKTKVIGGLTGAAALAALALIIPFEGKSNTAYLDEPKVPSICYGHTKGVQLGQVADDQQCIIWLGQDVVPVSKAIYKNAKVPLPTEIEAAFISLGYNIGIGNLLKSSAWKTLNKGDYSGACARLIKWICVRVPSGTGDSSGQCATADLHMKASAGLKRRRQAEMDMCLAGVP